MALPKPLFYFTDRDPDFTIKGSRDPLGLQVIWQKTARPLIPYLSTVSGNIRDFQILALAYYFYGRPADNRFIPFFLRFEQLAGYARYRIWEGGFGGVSRVRNRLAEGSTVTISNLPKDEILGNQRAYGIWAKYNRPFHEAGLLRGGELMAILERKISRIRDREPLRQLVARIRDREHLRVDTNELPGFEPLLSLTAEERLFFEERLLRVSGPTPYQDRLFDFLKRNGLPDPFHLYEFLQAFARSDSAQFAELPAILFEMEATERMLAPLNHIFRYLQTKPVWTRSELLADGFITRLREARLLDLPHPASHAPEKHRFAAAMRQDNWSLALELVRRNEEVVDWRGGSAWMNHSGELLEVHYSDGGHRGDFNPETGFDNDYFLRTYCRLFHQLHP